jgi:hypothetical protein
LITFDLSFGHPSRSDNSSLPGDSLTSVFSTLRSSTVHQSESIFITLSQENSFYEKEKLSQNWSYINKPLAYFLWHHLKISPFMRRHSWTHTYWAFYKNNLLFFGTQIHCATTWHQLAPVLSTKHFKFVNVSRKT